MVLPSRQRAYAVRLAHAAAELRAGARAWLTPDVLPLDGWLRREIARQGLEQPRLPRLLTQAEEWWLWRQCTAEATSELPLLNRGALAEALRRASTLAFDFCIDASLWGALPGEEAAVLLTVSRAVEARAREQGAATVSSLLAQVPCLGTAGPVVFRGFLAPAPRLEALAAARAAHGHDSGRSDVLGAAPEVSPASPRVVSAQDEDEELERIAQWCRDRLERDRQARLLVMVPGTAGRRERLAALIHQALDPRSWLGLPGEDGSERREPVVIEGGEPLSRRPAVAHALTSLGWLAGRAVDAEALAEWLQAPYWRGMPAADRALLELWLGEKRLHPARGGWQGGPGQLVSALRQAPATLQATAGELARRVMEGVAALAHPAASARVWAMRADAALDELGWPGDRSRDSGEQQTVVRFRELLDELGSLGPTVGQVTRESAVQWLTELAERTAFRPADEDPVVTISPQLIDPVVRYDAIWVAGLHAGSFPAPVQPDPFLPLQAQLAARVPQASARGRVAEAQALLAAWRAATPQLTLGSPARAEDLELVPSPLLAPWRQEAGRGRVRVWLPYEIHREGLLETLEDPVGLPWPGGRALPSGTRSLELQNQCPFRAYAELRLAASQRQMQELGAAPDVRGQLLHAALQQLWGRLKDSAGLAAMDAGALGLLIEQCVAEAARPLQTPHRAAFAREALRARRLIARLCELERQRPAFAVTATEIELACTLAGWPLTVRIDRVDELPGVGRAILDYKSGRRVAADWYGERPSHPQLLAYLAALGDDVRAVATVNLNAREVRFEGVASSASLLPAVKEVAAPPGTASEEAWRLRLHEWRACVERLAADFAAGQAAVDPRPGACKLCHVMSVCRIADRDVPPDAEPA